ncbi:MAG: gfo/Idh/MocA family oxidoreductase [Balneolaceae bacterium]|nr:MAG: gfo/Idh/MocA family oxidoreductase [Balneolaceae bacterium]
MKSHINRKEFLKMSGTVMAAASFGFPNIIIPKRKDTLGVALVGLGNYSTGLLAPGLQLTQHCELRGIVTGSPEKIPVWQERHNIPDANVYNYENMHQVAGNDDIDVIYVVTPPGLHAEHSIIGANAGKHVWCEKPMAVTVEECQAIIDAATKNRVQLTIGYRMQHEPNTQTIISYGKNETFGPVTEVRTAAGYRAQGLPADDWRFKPEMGGGALYDMGVYPINASRYSTSKKVVAARGTQRVEREEMFRRVDETTEFELLFEDDIIATCKTSMGENVNYLEVDTEEGWYFLRPASSYTNVGGEVSDGTLLEPYTGHQQARQMDNDALAIIENRPPIVPGEDGMEDIRIVKAIMESSDKGGDWIYL